MPTFMLSQFAEPELVAIWDYIAIDNFDAADCFWGYLAAGTLALSVFSLTSVAPLPRRLRR
jgi:plasmid stabilization system protein ParE